MLLRLASFNMRKEVGIITTIFLLITIGDGLLPAAAGEGFS